MASASRSNGVYSNLNIALGPIFKSDGAGKARCQLSMILALCGSGANGSPRHEIGHILRCDGVQKFARCGHAHVINGQQQFASQRQALVNLKTAINVRIVNVSLPAQARPRFLKIGSHDDFEFVSVLLTDMHQSCCVLERSLRIMDGAGAYDYEKTLIVAAHDCCDFGPRRSD